MRVLTVDDQDFIRRGLKTLLFKCAVKDKTVERRLLKMLLPDVVIMDISLPIVNGLQATRVIREFFPRVQVVTVSQYELGDLGDVLQVGARAHVAKTAVWENLIDALGELPLE